MMCGNFSEVWIREEHADHFIYIKLGTDFSMLLSFAAPIDLFCAWATEELKEKIVPKYFWAVVGAILFEELHGDGFQIENFLSWVTKKGLKDLVKTPLAL